MPDFLSQKSNNNDDWAPPGLLARWSTLRNAHHTQPQSSHTLHTIQRHENIYLSLNLFPPSPERKAKLRGSVNLVPTLSSPISALPVGFNFGRILIPICGYPDRFQKLIRASLRFSFPPAILLGDIFSVQVLVNRKRSNAVDIALFATGLLLYWVGILLGVGNYSRFGNGLIFEFGEVSVGLVITKVCDGVLK